MARLDALDEGHHVDRDPPGKRDGLATPPGRIAVLIPRRHAMMRRRVPDRALAANNKGSLMRTPPRLMRAVALATALAAAVLAPCSRAESAAKVDTGIKLAFLYNFSKFVHWPESALPPEADRINLCIAGDPYLIADMDSALGTKQAQGRMIALLDATRIVDPRRCHLLFVTERSQESAVHLLEQVRDAAVLTIGENEAFAHRGIIGLYAEEQKLRFAVNLDAAGRAGLELNARLLGLAKVVSGD